MASCHRLPFDDIPIVMSFDRFRSTIFHLNSQKAPVFCAEIREGNERRTIQFPESLPTCVSNCARNKLGLCRVRD